MSKYTTLLLFVDSIYKIVLEEEHTNKFNYLTKKLDAEVAQAACAQQYRGDYTPKNESVVKEYVTTHTSKDEKELLELQKAYEEKRWQRESLETTMKNLRTIIEAKDSQSTATLGTLRTNDTKEQNEDNPLLTFFNTLRDIRNEELHTAKSKPITPTTFENFFKERGL